MLTRYMRMMCCKDALMGLESLTSAPVQDTFLFGSPRRLRKLIEVVAMDLSECMVRIAKNNTASLHSIVAIRGDAHNLPFKDESFQVVMSKLTPCSIDEALRVLKPGGWYILQMSGLYDRWLEIEDVFGDRAYQLDLAQSQSIQDVMETFRMV